MSKRLVFVRQTPSGPIGRNAIRQGRLRSLHGSHPRWLHEHKMLHKNKIQVVTTHPLACHLHSFFTKSIQGYCFVNNSVFFSPSMLSCVQPCLNASYSRCSHAELRVVVIFLNKHSFRKQNLKEGFRSLFASGGYFLSMDPRHCWEPLCQWPPMWLKSLFRGHWGTSCPHRQPSPHCQTLPSPSVQPDVKECPAWDVISSLFSLHSGASQTGYLVGCCWLKTMTTSYIQNTSIVTDGVFAIFLFVVSQIHFFFTPLAGLQKKNQPGFGKFDLLGPLEFFLLGICSDGHNVDTAPALRYSVPQGSIFLFE